MNKRYEYNGKIYCEDDLSESIDNYGGELYDLYWELSHDHLACDVTYYYATDGEKDYETAEELIESEFSELEVKEEMTGRECKNCEYSEVHPNKAPCMNCKRNLVYTSLRTLGEDNFKESTNE